MDAGLSWDQLMSDTVSPVLQILEMEERRQHRQGRTRVSSSQGLVASLAAILVRFSCCSL